MSIGGGTKFAVKIKSGLSLLLAAGDFMDGGIESAAGIAFLQEMPAEMPSIDERRDRRSRRSRRNSGGSAHSRGMSELDPFLPSFRRPPASRGCAFM